MGMSTHVAGFKPADEKWKAMKAAWDACAAACVPIPQEVRNFFNGDTPDPGGVEVDMKELVKCGAIVEWDGSSQSGYELHVDKLPKDVKVVRFYNSW